MKPTTEQAHATELFVTGDSLAIEAGAGTGKTSTLQLLAKATDDPGQYIAFNKAIVEEAKAKFPRWVRCNTAHSLAYRAVVARNEDYQNRLRNDRRITNKEIAHVLGFSRSDEIAFQTPSGEQKVYTPARLAGHTMRAISRFCQTADPVPNRFHVPFVQGIDHPDGEFPNNAALREVVGDALTDAWDEITAGKGRLPFKHEHYLKIWQSGNPKIDTDYILFDEAQDANPVMQAIVAAQTQAQLVWVGDSQQQIYSWMGAINALSQVPADRRAFLTQSFRFGPAIADKANEILERLDAELRITGLDSIDSVVGSFDEPEVFLARTNSGAVGRMLAELTQDRRAHLVGGGGEISRFVKAVKELEERGETSHPDLWMFGSWDDVAFFARNDEEGGDLRMLVNLVEEHGVDPIITALDHMPSQERADLIISTAHKAKGREWGSVALLGDFPEPTEEFSLSDEEYRLLYVACTRAQVGLDVRQVPHLDTAPPVGVLEDDE